MKERRRGIAIPVVMAILLLCIIVVVSVANAGLGTLYMTGGNHLSQQSVAAAEAGVAASIRQIIAGTAGWNGFAHVPFGTESEYSVQVIAGPSSGPDRPFVPAGCAYLLATGKTHGKHERRVGVLLRTVPAGQVSTAYSYVLATGGAVSLGGGGDIDGSIKTSGDLHLQGGMRVTSSRGSGRLIAGADLDIGNGIKRDPSQDMRARNSISVGPHHHSPDPVAQIYPDDRTADTMPWLNDGRFTNTRSPGDPLGEVLPHPDPVKLLGLIPVDPADPTAGYQKDSTTGLYLIDPARTDVVQHAETTTGSLNLGGKIHFFPNGVNVGSVRGPGTVVSGEGHDVTVGHTSATVNVLALQWPGQPATGNVDLQGVNLTGMVYANKDVHCQGNNAIDGMVVAYNGDVDGNGHRTMSFNPCGLALPGFESWCAPAPSTPPGPGTACGLPGGQEVVIISWQRL